MKKLSLKQMSLKDFEILKDGQKKIYGGYGSFGGCGSFGFDIGYLLSGSYRTNTSKDYSFCMTTGQGTKIESWGRDSLGYTTPNGRYSYQGTDTTGTKIYNQQIYKK